jgi:hypothetical protein
MSSIRYQKFFRVLKKLNPDFRFFPAIRGRAAMIYITQPSHPDCNRLGLQEVVGYPAEIHGSFPKYDFVDIGGMRGRGYSSVFKILVRKRLIDRHRLVALIPGALDPGITEPEQFIKREKPDVPQIPIYRIPVREFNAGPRK